VASLLCHQSRVWVDYVGDNKHMGYVITPSDMSFYMKMRDVNLHHLVQCFPNFFLHTTFSFEK